MEDTSNPETKGIFNDEFVFEYHFLFREDLCDYPKDLLLQQFVIYLLNNFFS